MTRPSEFRVVTVKALICCCFAAIHGPRELPCTSTLHTWQRPHWTHHHAATPPLRCSSKGWPRFPLPDLIWSLHCYIFQNAFVLLFILLPQSEDTSPVSVTKGSIPLPGERSPLVFIQTRKSPRSGLPLADLQASSHAHQAPDCTSDNSSFCLVLQLVVADYIQSELQLKAGRDKGDLHELDGTSLSWRE